jgi:hypothetical protein
MECEEPSQKEDEFANISRVPEQITDIINNDKEQKVISYKNLLFEVSGFHLFSTATDENGVNVKCERDTGYEDWQPQQISISIHDFTIERFADSSAALEYLISTYQDYSKISIFHDVTDMSGITDMYCISNIESALYIVFIAGDIYAVESDSNILQYDIFRDWQEPDIKAYKYDIPCGGGYTSKVIETIFLDERKAEYVLTQGKSGEKYYADVKTTDDGVSLIFNGKGSTQQNYYGESHEYEYFANFLDLNRDGYADMKLRERTASLNNSYALYIWNESLNEHERVRCDELLSEIDVYDGYILNYQKSDASSGIIQKLVWDNNVLILKSETPYEVDG